MKRGKPPYQSLTSEVVTTPLSASTVVVYCMNAGIQGNMKMVIQMDLGLNSSPETGDCETSRSYLSFLSLGFPHPINQGLYSPELL